MRAKLSTGVIHKESVIWWASTSRLVQAAHRYSYRRRRASFAMVITIYSLASGWRIEYLHAMLYTNCIDTSSTTFSNHKLVSRVVPRVTVMDSMIFFVRSYHTGLLNIPGMPRRLGRCSEIVSG